MDDKLNRDVDKMGREQFAYAMQELGQITNGQVIPKVIRFYERADVLMKPFDSKLDCQAGCSYCCHYHIMASPAEIFALSEALQRTGSQLVKATIAKLETYLRKTEGMTREEHIRTNIPCVLLSDGKCSVYSVRPLACRGHHSLDVTNCRQTFVDTGSPQLSPMSYGRKVISTTFDNLSLTVQHKLGRDTNKYELHAALFEALTNPSCLKRWKSGKTAFPNVRDRSTLAEMIGE